MHPDAATTDTEPAAEGGVRWDPLVRLTHWGIALAVLLNGIVTEEGSSPHVWVGYVAFALLALRLLWGVVGPPAARFSAFPPSLSAARAHVGDLMAGRHRHHRSHNPLGTLMVYALWATLAAVTLSGIAMAGSPFAERPAATEVAMLDRAEAAPALPLIAVDDDGDEDGERHGYGEGAEDEAEDELLEELHETAANLLFLLAGLHVAGVAVESWLSGRNLTRGMLGGGGPGRGDGRAS